jgi:hypothetical protein
MDVVGWNNGSPDNRTGAGYGIRIERKDRDRYFKKNWEYVCIVLNNKQSVNVKISKSFWRGCIELRSSRIGKWMINQKLAPWSKGNPPRFEMELIEDNKFALRR